MMTATETIARVIRTQTDTSPSIPVWIEVIDSPQARRPLTVKVPRDESFTGRSSVTPYVDELTGGTSVVADPSLDDLWSFERPLPRVPTTRERRLHEGRHRSVERRPVLESFTVAAFAALIALAAPVAYAISMILLWLWLG